MKKEAISKLRTITLSAMVVISACANAQEMNSMQEHQGKDAMNNRSLTGIRLEESEQSDLLVGADRYDCEVMFARMPWNAERALIKGLSTRSHSGAMMDKHMMSGAMKMGMSDDKKMGMSDDKKMGMSDDKKMGMSDDKKMGMSDDKKMGMSDDKKMDMSGDKKMDMSGDKKMGMSGEMNMGMSGEMNMGMSHNISSRNAIVLLTAGLSGTEAAQLRSWWGMANSAQMSLVIKLLKASS